MVLRSELRESFKSGSSGESESLGIGETSGEVFVFAGAIFSFEEERKLRRSETDTEESTGFIRLTKLSSPSIVT